MCLKKNALSEDSDQPAYPRSQGLALGVLLLIAKDSFCFEDRYISKYFVVAVALFKCFCGGRKTA